MFQQIANSVTLVIAFAVAVIAFLQFKVAHDKLRLDLFDRRYKVYDATRRFLSVIAKPERFEDSFLAEFYAATSDATFLFDTDVSEYLQQIRERAVYMRLQDTFYQSKQGDNRPGIIDPVNKDRVWISEQLAGVTKVFTPYLSYAKIKGNFFEDLIK